MWAARRSEHTAAIASGARRYSQRVSSLDTARKFVLDIRFFSSIIYILYEGLSLKPPIVTAPQRGSESRHLLLGGRMAKKTAKKAAKKKAAKKR
jgi:methyl coenzyme M reductase subunit D